MCAGGSAGAIEREMMGQRNNRPGRLEKECEPPKKPLLFLPAPLSHSHISLIRQLETGPLGEEKWPAAWRA